MITSTNIRHLAAGNARTASNRGREILRSNEHCARKMKLIGVNWRMSARG